MKRIALQCRLSLLLLAGGLFALSLSCSSDGEEVPDAPSETQLARIEPTAESLSLATGIWQEDQRYPQQGEEVDAQFAVGAVFGMIPQESDVRHVNFRYSSDGKSQDGCDAYGKTEVSVPGARRTGFSCVINMPDSQPNGTISLCFDVYYYKPGERTREDGRMDPCAGGELTVRYVGHQ